MIPVPEGASSADRVLSAAVALDALARNGLHYAEGRFDRDRYTDVHALAAELLSVVSDRGVDELTTDVDADQGHVTPRVDVRGAVVDSRERLLLMCERSDGLWSLPGGWADPGDTPTSACVREVLEETGQAVEVLKLVGVWDRDAQGHRPRLAVAAWKLFFLCRATGPQGEPEELETLETGWFGLDELPPLSLGRVSPRQLERVVAHHRDPSLPTELD